MQHSSSVAPGSAQQLLHSGQVGGGAEHLHGLGQLGGGGEGGGDADVAVLRVVSIGIRTTKLEALGNIKIINNSEIRGVLNQTVELSTAKSLIDIEYGASLERVEEIIKTKLPEIVIDGVTGGISYDGVATLGASGVTLQFTAKCYEGDIFAIQREMNKRLKVMFDENGINIPFNQLVVHMEK